MKKSRIVKSLIAILTVISVVSLCFMGVGCSSSGGGGIPSSDSNNQHIVFEDNFDDCAVLEAYVRCDGTEQSGDALIVDYTASGMYSSVGWVEDGFEDTIEELRIDCYVNLGYKKQTSSSFQGGIQAGKSQVGVDVGAGSGVQYATCQADNMHATANSGEYELNISSNYIIFEAEYLDTHSLAVSTTLRLKGKSTPYSVSAVV
ncbi:MAG: hypothetical protein IJF40_04780 [Clostridia bacterium]|nr:hypothetical protein [Clostridia bacterium]MBQ7046151.1 hypothetical protein [Oscillospiraceae bacterium]